jgi:hypothetical protein
VPDPDSSQLHDLTHGIARALRAARDRLLARMAELGLDAESGWRVKEELRHTVKGTEWILSPIHLREPSPALEERVCIDEGGRLLAEGE